jgi:Flp pilus assembly protein TadG
VQRDPMKSASLLRWRREDGAAAIEFALLTPLIVILIFGMIEFGVAFQAMQSFRAGTREGARVAAVGASRDEIWQAVQKGSSGSLGGLDSSAVTIVPANGCDGNNTLGQDVTVTVDTGSGSTYPSSGMQSALQVTIPLLPSFDLHPTISGTFRCEQ